MSGIKNLIQLVIITSQMLLYTLVVAATEISTHNQNTDRPHLDFVTFIEPPYFFDPAVSDNEGLVSIILKQLMQKAGINYRLTIMPPKRAELFVQFTPNTCVIPIEKSQEREVFFTWVSPVLISQTGLFQLASAPPVSLRTLEDARPYRIGSYLGSSIGDYLSSFSYQVDLVGK